MSSDVPFEYTRRWQALADSLLSGDPESVRQAVMSLDTRDRDLEDYLKTAQGGETPTTGGLPRFWFVGFQGDGTLLIPGGGSRSYTLVTNDGTDELFVNAIGGFQLINGDDPGGAITLDIGYAPTSGHVFNDTVNVDVVTSANGANAAVPGAMGIAPSESGELIVTNFGSDDVYLYGVVTISEVSSFGWV